MNPQTTGWLKARFELSRESAGANLRSMEGIRGFAVALVFLTHYCTLVGPWISDVPVVATFAHALHSIGNVGVDLFFVLSGYLIYKTLVSREQSFGHFMARRIRRIYPAFLVVFAVYCALSFVFSAQSSIPRDAPAAYLLANLLLLPGLFPIKPMITVAWSLSYEMFFYLCLPPIVAALRLRAMRCERRIVLIALAAIALCAWSAVSGSGHVRMAMFMSGMLVHESIHSRQVRAPAGGVLALVLAAGLLSNLLPFADVVKTAVLFAAFYLVCLGCLVRPGEGLGRAFSWTPLRWLGNMSYSYYLIHGLALKALFLLLSTLQPALLQGHGAAVFFVLLPVFFLVTLLASAGLFLLVERPLSLSAPSAGPAGAANGVSGA